MRKTFLLVSTIYIASCGESRDMYALGYDDGHATGYNTTCKIRATLVEGTWDNQDYKRGYDQGYAAGAAECRSGVKY